MNLTKEPSILKNIQNDPGYLKSLTTAFLKNTEVTIPLNFAECIASLINRYSEDHDIGNIELYESIGICLDA